MNAQEIIDRLKAALKHSRRIQEDQRSSVTLAVLHGDIARILNEYEANMHPVDIAKRPWRMYGD